MIVNEGTGVPLFQELIEQFNVFITNHLSQWTHLQIKLTQKFV